MKSYLLGFLVWVLYRSLSWTWRVTLIEPPVVHQRWRDHQSMIFAHWHGQELALIHLVGHYRVATIASTSKDGEIMNTALRLFGAKTSRGSSTRGGVTGMRGLLRFMKHAKLNASFAVDGPKGPLYKAKAGVFEMSRLLQAPIVPGGVACDRAWHFPKSWNKTFLPKPFARVLVQWLEPFPALTSEDDPRDPKFSETLENALHQGTALAQKNLAARVIR